MVSRNRGSSISQFTVEKLWLPHVPGPALVLLCLVYDVLPLMYGRLCNPAFKYLRSPLFHPTGTVFLNTSRVMKSVTAVGNKEESGIQAK